MKPMFDGIDKIDWARLRQAHGNAEHVPAALENLISSSETTRKEAYWDLYEAAFYVLPFLLEILTSDIQHGRRLVYNLLFEIVNGASYEDVTCTYNGKPLPLTEACRAIIADSRSVFLSEISNQQSDCRQDALDLVVSLNAAENVVPLLRRIRDVEPASDFRDSIEEAIAEMEMPECLRGHPLSVVKNSA